MARIAVVEDDPLARELLVDALEGRDHVVEAFEDAGSARAALGASPPDLLVSDIDLPDGSGFDLIRALRAVHPDLLVIVQSGRDTEGDLLEGFDAGAADYITKPISVAELLAKCSVLLARKQKLHQPEGADKAGTDLPGGASAAFGRYRIERVLGSGGGAVVFLAEDLREGSEVALKVLPTLAGLREETRQRFVRETYALSMLEHPQVVGVLDFGSTEGRVYYTMERIEGVSLHERVTREGPASEAELLQLLAPLASALEAIHGAGLLHRDLKPSNIMLRGGDYGDPVVIDFGLAKLEGDTSITNTGELLGTPAYLSPERIRCQETTAQSDLFSLGLVARFALTGEHPYADADLVSLLNALASRPIHFPERVSPPLRQVLRRMTRLSPSSRQASATELLADLRGLGASS